MGNRRISDDLKDAALRMVNKGYATPEILSITQISKSTIYRTQRRKRATGGVAKIQAIGRGRPRAFTQHDVQFLIRLARHNPTLFLDEYQTRLRDGRFLLASLSTIHQSFKRAGINVKHIEKIAAERDPLRCADFVRRVSQYSPASLLCLDEVSKDDRTYSRRWGRAGIVAAKVVEGSFNRESFIDFLRNDVV
ncbi:hypothetical protein C8R48DRAFT_569848, partial [Suillus tomentosus]